MIHVLALITVKPGKLKEVLAAFEKIVPAVHKEKGCIEYGAAAWAASASGLAHFSTTA